MTWESHSIRTICTVRIEYYGQWNCTNKQIEFTFSFFFFFFSFSSFPWDEDVEEEEGAAALCNEDEMVVLLTDGSNDVCCGPGEEGGVSAPGG